MKNKKIDKLKNVEEILLETYQNVVEDRAVMSALLYDLVVWIKSSTDRNEKVGNVAAKYSENLQRSNEQLLKLVDLIKKNKIRSDVSFSGDEKDEIYDEIQNKQLEEDED